MRLNSHEQSVQEDEYMKKLISLTLALVLLMSAAACKATASGEEGGSSATAEAAGAAADTDASTGAAADTDASTGAAADTGAGAGAAADAHEITSAAFPLCMGEMEMGVDLPLYFLDGVDDLPYIEFKDFQQNLLDNLFDDFAAGIDVQFTVEENGPVLVCRRLDDTYHILMTIDFDKNTIDFVDYNLFCQRAGSSTILDSVTLNVVDEAGDPVLLEKVDTDTYTRFGDELTFALGDYGIDLIYQDGLYLVPLQTMSDILVPGATRGSLFFNGRSVIITTNVNECADLYYAAPTGARSEALTKFGYGELCMMLDYFYGFKDTHRIESFDKLFHDVGFEEILKDPDPEQADRAIYRLITDFLDDNHSRFLGFSYLTGPSDYKAYGADGNKIFDHIDTQKSARAAFYPDGIPGYEEIGNTAYITLDNFECYAASGEEYYTVEDPQDFGDDDTIGLIIKAHAMINREDSPIENVVLDLSANIGGMDDAAVFAISWFLGEANISMVDNLTGAMCSTTYRADVNRDRVFDEKDSVADKNLFCLISPACFSCGNLVPCEFKESGKVTLLGRKTSGGSCGVLYTSSAWGTAFQISANTRLSFRENGAFYDIDRGADPDYTISRPEKYYDRAALTEYINGIY